MSDRPQSDNDAWLRQLREALAEDAPNDPWLTGAEKVELPDEDDEAPELEWPPLEDPPSEPTPTADVADGRAPATEAAAPPPRPSPPAAPAIDPGVIEAGIQSLHASVDLISARIDQLETKASAPPPPAPQPVEMPDVDLGPVENRLSALSSRLDAVVGAVERLQPSADLGPVEDRLAALASGLNAVVGAVGRLEDIIVDLPQTISPRPGLSRLEPELQSLHHQVARLTRRIDELPPPSSNDEASDLREQIRLLGASIEAVERRLSGLEGSRHDFIDAVHSVLRGATNDHGERVAWADVLVLAEQLRSRVDDLHDHQRRVLGDLAQWQASADEQLISLRSLVRELRDNS